MYLSAPELLTRLGASELTTTVGYRFDEGLDKEAFVAVLQGLDTSTLDPDYVVVAQQASEFVEAELKAAQVTIDGYLSERHELPLPAHTIQESVLPEVARHLVVYALYPNPDETVQRNHKYAIDTLGKIQGGKIQLGENDPTINENKIRVDRSHSQFNWGAFGR